MQAPCRTGPTSRQARLAFITPRVASACDPARKLRSPCGSPCFFARLRFSSPSCDRYSNRVASSCQCETNVSRENGVSDKKANNFSDKIHHRFFTFDNFVVIIRKKPTALEGNHGDYPEDPKDDTEGPTAHGDDTVNSARRSTPADTGPIEVVGRSPTGESPTLTS